MDAVKAFMERARMCSHYGCDGCGGCPLNRKCGGTIGTLKDAKEAVEIVEKWSKEHPLKTNGMKVLEAIPGNERRTALCDLIKRQAAIDAAVEAADEWDGGYSRSREEIITLKLRMLPSADRPKGKWIPYLPERLRYKCSECESKYDTPWHFCPNCGSYNGGESDDKG